jgi:primase-polymerase (primpol)-like protein
LRELPHWVCWRYEVREGKWTKPPVNARSGRLADITSPSTWSTYSEAFDTYRRCGYDGIGFVVHKKTEEHADPFVVLDLDHCRDPQSGSIELWAQEIIDALASYTELSPSGTGIRVIVRGRLPEGARNRKDHFEVYESSRYVTITGQVLDSTPHTIADRQKQLLQVYAKVFG